MRIGATKIIQLGSTIYATTSFGVQTSTDAGQTWTLRWPTSLPAITLAGNGSTVYIGLQNGSLLVSNGGASPASIYAFSGLGSLTPQVHDIVVDPATPTAVYVSLQGFVNGIFSDGLYASVDGGRTFNLVTLPVDIRGAQAIAMSPSTPHLLYVLGTRLYTTVDGGATFSPYGYYGDGRSITPIAGTPDALYVADDQGLYAQKGGPMGQ